MKRNLYKVTDRDGNRVGIGDKITDFRGDVAYFRGVSRGVEYNGTAKVLSVRDPEADRYSERESYAGVFDLTVETTGTETTYTKRRGGKLWSVLICEETGREGAVVYYFDGPVKDGENTMSMSITDVDTFVKELTDDGYRS